MKILMVGASADWSTHDVETGYRAAFEALGHEVKLFRLTRRLEFWAESLDHWSKMTGQKGAELEQVIREASLHVLIEAALYRPDLVLIISGMGFHPDAVALLRQHGYRVGVAFTEAPYDDEHHERFVPLCDHVFVNDLHSVERLRAVNPDTHYVGTAYSESVHRPQEPMGSADVLFVGTGFGERQTLLEAVDWSGIDLQLFGFFGWEKDLTAPLAAVTREPVTNDEAARRYCGAKICLNFYRSGAGYSLNPRAYELAACGAFQLAQDSVPEAHEVFGDSIAYFTDAQSLEAQVRYYLANQSLRDAMAAESMLRVQGHSYTDRARKILRHVEVLTMS